MSKQTKLKFNNDKFKQTTNDNINLSGETTIDSGYISFSGGSLIVNQNSSIRFDITNPDNGKVLSSEGTGGILKWDDVSLRKSFIQETELNVGDVVGYDNGVYTKAIADGTYEGEIIGIVTSKSSFGANYKHEITMGGYVNVPELSLVSGTTYFLSDTTAGLITDTEPTTDGHISKAVILADSPTSGWVLPYPGYLVSSGSSTSLTNINNIGEGIGVYDSTELDVARLRSIIGSGNTTISLSGDTIVVHTEGSGDAIRRTINQTNHPFQVMDVVGFSGDTYNKPIADGSYDGEVLGLVNNIIDVDNFEFTQAGYVDNLSGLVQGTTYFLSDVTAGLITDTEPTTDGHISNTILLADSTTSGWVLPYVGYIVTTGDTSSVVVDTQLDSGSTNPVENQVLFDEIRFSGTAERSVGGISEGDVFTNATMIEMWNTLISQEKFPTLTEPSSTFTLSETGLREVGLNISSISVNSSFNRGSINPQYTAASDLRSGPADEFILTGTQLSDYTNTNTDDAVVSMPTQYITNYNVLVGDQSWSGSVSYEEGVQPKSSYDNDYDSPLPSGTTTPITRTITGVYPFFATTDDIATLEKQSLAPHGSTIVLDLVTESGGNKQKIQMPVQWGTLSLVEQYDFESGLYFVINGGVDQFTETAVNSYSYGNGVNDYRLYTHNGSSIGERRLRFTF
ncbi:MAG: hypothetical protein ACOCZ5_00300 [bacterium]